jgi:hypothetical protein
MFGWVDVIVAVVEVALLQWLDLRSLREVYRGDNWYIQSQQEETRVVMEVVGNHLDLQTVVEGIDSFHILVEEGDIHASADNLETAEFVGVAR